jgi:hypothetical protein
MKPLALLVSLLFITFTLHSQNLYTYATVTAGQSMLLSHEWLEVEPLNHLNFNAGAGYWFGEYLTTEVGVSYIIRGVESFHNFAPRSSGTDRNWFLAFPVLANFNIGNFYLGVGPTINFYVARKYEDYNFSMFNTTEKHDQIPTASISFAAQTGYNLPITNMFSLRGGLYVDYLPGNLRYRNHGAELGVLVNLN